MPGPSIGGDGPSRRIDAVLTLVLAAASVALLEAGAGAEVALSQALRDTVLRPFLQAQEWVGRRADLEARLEGLVAENARLQAEVVRRRGLARENQALRELVAIAGEEARFVATEVYPGEPRLGVARRFLLAAGRDRGVEAPTGVVTADGVVGVVRTATGDGSVGDFWTHPDFRVSVRVREGQVAGIVRPDESDAEQPLMVFEGAPYQDELADGTVLVTTGAGGVYPPGVPVGTIQGIAAVETGWARSYRVRPAVRPAEVASALVWIPPPGARDMAGGAVPAPWRVPAAADTATAPDTAGVSDTTSSPSDTRAGSGAAGGPVVGSGG